MKNSSRSIDTVSGVSINHQQQLIPLESMEFAAECLRTLAHPHRLRIVEILLDHDESVGELARACMLPSHMVSDHLRILKDRGFLDNERQGRKVFYRIAEPALADIMHCIQKRFGTQCADQVQQVRVAG